ncbi:MAG: fumarate hydratase C-terminal domain-containing protein [Elusimicrobiaceae bacterium]|nr:fumarate hydratase C-terminal domain-containing protein [Elusimicrobiaceae bacterium]
MKTYHLINPSLKDFNKLKKSDFIYLTSTVYVLRDMAHKKLLEEKVFPLNLKGKIIYYAGPTPKKKGQASGALGPTTSSRMDKFCKEFIKKTGIIGIIGKGARSREANLCQKGKVIYFAAPGGLGALGGNSVKNSKIILYPELGPEAVYKVQLENLPLIVAQDLKGNNIYGE